MEEINIKLKEYILKIIENGSEANPQEIAILPELIKMMQTDRSEKTGKAILYEDETEKIFANGEIVEESEIEEGKMGIIFKVHGRDEIRKLDAFIQNRVLPIKEKYPYAEIHIEVDA